MVSREIRRFDVLFKDPTATFKPGDVVKGNVQLELNQEVKMKGIKLFLQGISRCSWDEKKSYTKGSASKLSHKNYDVYLDELIIILGRVEGGSLKPGRYDWPFTVRLPPYLPSSFEGQYGRVQYWAKAVIDRPWTKGDTDFTRNFTVLAQLDLNTEADAKKAIEGSADTMAGSLCCKTGPITGLIQLPNRGYTSGQNIPFHVRIENQSSRPIRNVRVALSQQTIFRADKQVRKQSVMLKGKSWRDVNPRENVTWDDELKNIPPMPPSRLGGGCKNIEVKYLVSLVGKPPGPGKGLDVPVEVIIGTIPFRTTESGTPRMTVKAAARQEKETLTVAKGVTKRGASPQPQPQPQSQPQPAKAK